MKFTSTTIQAAMLAMAPLLANAHMILKSPVPFGNPNNSPLDPQGADFPCKMPSYTATTRANWAVGSQQKLEFTGTAVHGGGSCQVSVTTDKSPTPASKWKVIYSIEGGCPAAPKLGGNLQPDDELATYPFTVPAELPNGELIMSWSWFNKIGNREFYQNCAPITVTGGATDTSAFDKLPDMAVANIPKFNSCQTKEGVDYTFENPGNYKVKAKTGNFAPLCGGAPSAGGGDTSTPKQPDQPAQSPANPGSPSPPAAAITSTIHTIITVTAPSGPAPSAPPAKSGSPASPSAPLNPAPSAGKPALSPAPSPAPSQVPAPVPAPPSGTNAPCSPDGALICNGPSQFAICDHGKAIWQPVAQGTTCKDGKIARRNNNGDYITTLVRLYRPNRVRPE